MSSIRIIYASTGSHAKFVANRMTEAIVKASTSAFVMIETQAASLVTVADLLSADLLIFVSSAADGQESLHQDMQMLLERVQDIDFDGRWIACVMLGTDTHTCERIGADLQTVLEIHHGSPCILPLQLTGHNLFTSDTAITQWVDTLLSRTVNQPHPILPPKNAILSL